MCSSIVSRIVDGAIALSASLFGVRFRVGGVSARTGAILIRDRNLLPQRGQSGRGDLTSIAEAVQVNRRYLLHDAVTQQLVLSNKQILHEIVPALVRVAHCAGEMMVDSRACRATEIICDRKNFISRLALTEQPLRVRTCRADRE